MDKDTIVIRQIAPGDNDKISATIRSVLIEFGVPKVGTAYEDSALDCMFQTYNEPRSRYFVLQKGHQILGGAGIAPLEDFDPRVCELQKMYFSHEARGRGLGMRMMNQCLQFAKCAGYERCYLETMPYMDDARKLYRKAGFSTLDAALGNTGHYSCSVWMIRDV